MVHISIANLTKSKVLEKEVEEIVKKIINRLRRLKKFSFLKDVDLSIVFLEPEKIRELNKKYRKKDKPTDILSFTLERSEDKLAGEILLCSAVIKTKNYLLPTTHYSLKLNHLLAHGMLHLCGYNHKTKMEWEEMEKMAAQLTNDK